MGDRASIGSVGGFKTGGRSSVGSDTGFKPTRTSTESNNSFSASKKVATESDAFGGSNLAAKQKVVEDYYDNNVTLENVEEFNTVVKKFFREDIPAGATSALKAVAETLTPGFIRRFNNKKIYIKEIEERDA
jgi:hypothetical protein